MGEGILAVPKTFVFSPQRKIQSLEALPGFLLAQLKKYATWEQLGKTTKGPPFYGYLRVVCCTTILRPLFNTLILNWAWQRVLGKKVEREGW